MLGKAAAEFVCSSSPSLYLEEGMTEEQLRARIDRLQQLIAGLSKEYTHFRYAIGLHAHGGERDSRAEVCRCSRRERSQ
jgi:hypothetical protein